MKAVILAGGLGKRLRSVVSQVPKPMAPISGRPFLEILISSLQKKGISEITLSVGYQHEVIIDYFGDSYNDTVINYEIEESALGTGGALLAAISRYAADENIFVLNGDTFLDLNYREMVQAFENSGANVGIALKPLIDTYRYGRVVLNEKDDVVSFEEKGSHESGLINAGVYLLKPELFKSFKLPAVFSLENDFFVRHLHEIRFCPFITDNYFIDIGIPDDYERAQTELMSYM